MTTVQGTPIPVYYFETFRTIGFPAIVEHHLTLGVGYDVTERFAVNRRLHVRLSKQHHCPRHQPGQPAYLDKVDVERNRRRFWSELEVLKEYNRGISINRGWEDVPTG